MISPCDLITQHIGHLFKCADVNGYIRIRTPFLYPDGDIIDVYFRESDKNLFLSDLGSTLMWLNTQTLVERRTKRQLQVVHDVCVTHNVQFSNGALWLSISEPVALAESVARLAQAALRVSDIAFTFRPRTAPSVTEEVAEFLTEHSVPFRPNEKLKGYSNKEYTIEFFTYPPRRNSYVMLLSTGNPATATDLAKTANGVWHDLDVLKQSGNDAVPKFVTLFDDTQDVWTSEHERMLERDSVIAHWTDANDFLEKLEAA
jgi:hypothetical protein